VHTEIRPTLESLVQTCCMFYVSTEMVMSQVGIRINSVA